MGTLPSTPDDLWLRTITTTLHHKAVSYLDNCGCGSVTGGASLFAELILLIRHVGGEKVESVFIWSQAKAIKNWEKKKRKKKNRWRTPSCSSLLHSAWLAATWCKQMIKAGNISTKGPTAALTWICFCCCCILTNEPISERTSGRGWQLQN